jgi:hypothetical protein
MFPTTSGVANTPATAVVPSVPTSVVSTQATVGAPDAPISVVNTLATADVQYADISEASIRVIVGARSVAISANKKLRRDGGRGYVFPPRRNRSPHAGHSISSKSMRFISAGKIALRAFGQNVSRDASTFSRLILRDFGMRRPFTYLDSGSVCRAGSPQFRAPAPA